MNGSQALLTQVFLLYFFTCGFKQLPFLANHSWKCGFGIIWVKIWTLMSWPGAQYLICSSMENKRGSCSLLRPHSLCSKHTWGSRDLSKYPLPPRAIRPNPREGKSTLAAKALAFREVYYLWLQYIKTYLLLEMIQLILQQTFTMHSYFKMLKFI